MADKSVSNDPTKKPEPVAESVKPATPPPKPAAAPSKSAAPAKVDKPVVSRRSFLSGLTWLSAAWIAFSAGVVTALTALGRFMFPNVLFEQPQTFKIGFPNEYSMGIDERWKEKFRVWIIRTPEGFFALSGECTHLGCTPNYFAAEGKFKCPCHGSGFYAVGGKDKIGINFEGPAPRPLERFKITLGDDGQIMVDKTEKFQQEKGEWIKPDSFLRIS
jgi:cytochrome b6-f complex iron-sulfur subunit